MAYPVLFARWWFVAITMLGLNEMGAVAWWLLSRAPQPAWVFPLELGLTLGLFASGLCWITYLAYSDRYDWLSPDA